MTTAYLSIGSNQGDRHALLERAVALIAKAYPQALTRVSEPLETEPWGFESAYPFLNIAVALGFPDDAVPDPYDLLQTLHDIEKQISEMPHRNADGSYRDREIDIDIIEIDGVHIDTPRLTIPHPRAHLRPFVMIPLQSLKRDIQ